jgi:hypothetical protein
MNAEEMLISTRCWTLQDVELAWKL